MPDVRIIHGDLEIDESNLFAARFGCALAAISGRHAPHESSSTSEACLLVQGAEGTWAAFILRKTTLESGQQGGSIPSFLAAGFATEKLSKTVLSVVDCTRWHQFQVLRTVISLVAILVVHDFCWEKWPSEFLFHDHAMFVSSSVFTPDFGCEHDVTMRDGLAVDEDRILAPDSISLVSVHTTIIGA